MSISTYENFSNTNSFFLHRTRNRSQFIYNIALLAIILALGSMPFIYVTISVKGEGRIQPEEDRINIISPIDGRLKYINLIDNQTVMKGAILAVIDDAIPHEQIQLLDHKIIQLKRQLMDVELLVKGAGILKIGESQLKTKVYRTNWLQYIADFQLATNSIQQVEHTYLRYRALYEKHAVTLSELELHKFNFDQALLAQQIINKRYINQWQIEANQYFIQLNELQSQRLQLNEKIKQYCVRAMISGSVQNLASLQKDSHVFANQKLAEISPNTTLFAYLYVKPSDIALIKKGQSAHVQVDAFNYNQWGVLTGTIMDISDDSIMQNQSSYYKVKCKLNKNYLQLKNGYKRYIKKGMTLRANFVITKRSLYQLLYDNVNNWVSGN